MDNKMFCFQCEQTAGCSGCTGSAGVCGKTSEIANLQDELTAALIGLAKVCQNSNPTPQTTRLVIEGLFTTITNVNFNKETLEDMIERVKKEKNKISGNCLSCTLNYEEIQDFNMKEI